MLQALPLVTLVPYFELGRDGYYLHNNLDFPRHARENHQGEDPGRHFYLGRLDCLSYHVDHRDQPWLKLVRIYGR